MADLLRALAAGTAGAVGEAFLRALERELASALQADAVIVPEAGTDASGDAELEVPMRAPSGALIGHIRISSRQPIVLAAEDREALEVFASRAAAEIERLREEERLRAHEAEIAESRMRIVQSAEDERRRIGANLHDGAQQRLVAIGHFLDVARKKMGHSAPDAAPLVERARDEARAAGRELRELSRGLNPASLTERGLGVALETLAGNSPLPVQIGAVPHGRLPDPMETALYYVVSEALANAAKHADASRATVSIVQGDGAIVAEVSDDGVGGAAPGGGPGLQTLSDRVSALGGSLSIESPEGGGTVLRATIPDDPWRPRAG